MADEAEISSKSEDLQTHPSSDDPTKTVVITPETEGEALAHPSTTGNASDDYTICGRIGDGGMGIVYLAKDRRLARYVAIKRLNDKALADPVLRSRFLHEARAVAALNHAYIVHIYALGEDVLGPYIVMEYVSGPAQTETGLKDEGGTASPPPNLTLEQYIARHGSMTANEAIEMSLKIARTMVYAHSCGVIHRDLKPANILLDPTCEPKLVDFGLARIEPEGGKSAEHLTVPGVVMISLGYSAPELEQDASTCDERVDVYSLGAILYFLLTGRNPRYYRETDVPVFLREVLRRSLETVREQRYASARDFVRALTEAASHGKTVAPTVKTTWRCKWCDAVNPISTKFCSQCGWNGSEQCLECGAETFVGHQYCPSCGADCRTYEHVATLCKAIERAWDERHFERITSIIGQFHGFEPAGPTGRKMLDDAHNRLEEAERCIARRNRLAALIPTEINAENYERALVFIDEYRKLCEDEAVYERELHELPEKIFSRNLTRIRQCVREKDWATAQRLIEDLSVSHGNRPEFREVATLWAAHQRRYRRWCWWAAGVATVVLYILSLPFVGRLCGGTLSTALQVLYAPVKGLASLPPMASLYERYLTLCDSEDALERYFRHHPEKMAPVPRESLPGEAEEKRIAFEAEMNDFVLRRRQQETQLLFQYRQELAELRREEQEKGNYEGVLSVQQALDEYVQSNRLGEVHDEDTESLVLLKRTMMQIRDEQAAISARLIVATSKKYMTFLDETRRSYTQQGEMELAGQISTELQRVKSLPLVAENEALLANLGASGNALVLSGTAITSTSGSPELEVLQNIRDVLRVELERLDREAAELLGNWPQQYKTALSSLMEEYRKSGNFNAWEAVSAELARFEERAEMSQEDVAEFPAELYTVQTHFLTQRQVVLNQRDEEKRAVYRTHLSKLETLKSKLTKQGEMEAASTVNQVMRMICQEPRYVALERTPQETPPTPKGASGTPKGTPPAASKTKLPPAAKPHAAPPARERAPSK